MLEKSLEKGVILLKKSLEKGVTLLTTLKKTIILNIGGEVFMKREIYQDLLNWKNKREHKPLLILGARQVGKTYIINKFCQENYEHAVMINLFENTDVIDIYQSNLNAFEKYQRLKILLGVDLEQENTILFIDEIQESEKLIADLKFFCEKHPKIHIICAGSLLEVKLKRSKFSFPVGKVEMLTLYPMSFLEFLWAFHEELLIEEIESCFQKNVPMVDALHKKAMEYYRLYLITGGMPESVKAMVSSKKDVMNYDEKILEDIIDSYFKDMDKYVLSNSEALKIERIYHSIPSQLANESNKFQFSKVQSGAKSREYMSSLDWLLASNMAHLSSLVSTPEIPLKGFIKEDYFKLYLNDVGILNRLLEVKTADILLDNLSLYKGVITENYVADQLVNMGYSLYYWQSNGIAEIDFLLYTNDGVIPLEVKAGDNVQSKSLYVYIEKYHPKYSIRMSMRNFGFDKEKKIKSVPLYAIFCLKNL